MKKILIAILIAAILSFISFIDAVNAATAQSACGTISSSGDYAVTANLSATDTCLIITANDVILNGNSTYLNYSSGTGTGYGILVNNVKNVTIGNFSMIQQTNNSGVSSSVAIRANDTGTNGHNITIRNNTIKTFGPSGIMAQNDAIELVGITNSTIANNIIFTVSRGSYGIESDSANIIIANNNITSRGTSANAMQITGSSNTIVNNTLSGTDQYGIYTAGAFNIIERNNITDSGWGIYNDRGDDNNITNNTIRGSVIGILLNSIGGGNGDSLRNRVIGNNVTTTAAGGYAIRLPGIGANGVGINNTIYNNILNATGSNKWVLIDDGSANNSWNTTLTSGTNIFGGANLGGNYYGNSSRTGYSDACADINYNGICDTSLVHDANNTDYLPLAVVPTATTPVILFKEGAYEIRHNGTLVGKINTNEITSSITSGWHHVVLVYDKDGGSNNLKLYIDKILVATSTITGTIGTNNNKVIIGKNFTNSIIDEVKIWRRSLNQSEISFLYESSTKKVTASNEKHGIESEENITIVLSSPGASYFDNIKIKTGGKKLWLMIPYSKIDINDQLRIGPGEHNLIVLHNGTNSTTRKPIIRITE